MQTQTIDLPPLYVRAAVSSINEQARSVEVIFSTGAAVDRLDWSGKRYREVLSMKPEHVRLARLNAAAPLLDSHSAYSVGSVIGTVESGSARIERSQGLARIRFSRRASVDPIWQDVKDGILTSVSVGYRVYTFEESGTRDPVPTRTATDWEPYELSLVAMPADMHAKVRDGRREAATNPCVIVARGLAHLSVADADRNRRLRLAQARGF